MINLTAYKKYEESKMGRPKGSKNLPKKQVTQTVTQNTWENDPMEIGGGNQMLRLTNVDVENLHISLLAEVPGKGDWDFLISPPFVKMTGLTNPKGFYTPGRPPSKEIFEEAYVSLGDDQKPATLIIFVRILGGGIGGWRKGSVIHKFPKGIWGEQEYDN